MAETLVTSAGDFVVDWWVQPREGVLSLSVDGVVAGSPRDNPIHETVASPADVVRALVAGGVPESDALTVSRRLWSAGQQFARDSLERYLVTVLVQPFPERFTFANQWTKVAVRELVRVWAGALTRDPGAGVVVLGQASARGSLAQLAKPSKWTSVEAFDSASRCGKLVIASAAGDSATFSAADGSGWILDLPKRRLSKIPR